MLRVLFVDDDALVLRSLRRMLRRSRNDYEIQFCASGPEALSLLEHYRFDVIFSDMRMPGMSGTEFLDQVQQRHPQTARIALSGYMERSTVFDSIRNTHAFVAKPSGDDQILALIERFRSLLHAISSPELKARLAAMTTVPVLPAIYQQLTDAIDTDEASVAQISAIVQTDPAISAKLLQLSNSAYFGSPRKCLNIDEAISFMGIDSLRDLVLGLKIFDALSNPASEKMLTTIWKRCQVVAGVARKIARAEQLPRADLDTLMTASIVQDIGEILLIANSPTPLAGPYRWSLCGASTAKTLETALNGNDHTDIGVYLLSLWGIPVEVTECIAHQHRPERFADSARTPGHYLLAANAIVEARLKQGRSMLTLFQLGLFDRDTLQRWYRL